MTLLQLGDYRRGFAEYEWRWRTGRFTPFACPHPRWGLTGETTPWYPSMRLFRQERRGDWAGVAARITEALATLPGPAGGSR